MQGLTQSKPMGSPCDPDLGRWKTVAVTEGPPPDGGTEPIATEAARGAGRDAIRPTGVGVASHPIAKDSPIGIG